MKPINIIFVLLKVNFIYGHGMMIKPLSRGSIWRVDHTAPINYDDNSLYCGGFNKQFGMNDGKCGYCGDNYELKEPRPHENKGTYGKGNIVQTYFLEDVINVTIRITANHLGYFMFNICNLDSSVIESQECFEPLIFNTTSSSKHFLESSYNGNFNVTLKLPEKLLCEQCVLQWIYITGNNWGICYDGIGRLGCGPQEQFRNCADIRIVPKNDTTVYNNVPIPRFSSFAKITTSFNFYSTSCIRTEI